MAYSVKSLAKAWDCSPGLIYKLIRADKLKTFSVGTLKRISEEEVRRWENANGKPTEAETAPSDGEEKKPLPVSRMQMASVVGQG